MGIDNIFSRSFWNKWDFFFSNFKYATFSIPDSGHEHIAHFIYFNFLSLSDLKIQNIPRLSHLSISSSINESKELFWKSRNILFFADVRWSKWIFIADTDVVAIVVRQDFFFLFAKNTYNCKLQYYNSGNKRSRQKGKALLLLFEVMTEFLQFWE